MSDETNAVDTAKKDKAASAKATTAAVRVKVLKNGLLIAGSKAARGAIINVTPADSEAFEKRGEVVFLGAAK